MIVALLSTSNRRLILIRLYIQAIAKGRRVVSRLYTASFVTRYGFPRIIFLEILFCYFLCNCCRLKRDFRSCNCIVPSLLCKRVDVFRCYYWRLRLYHVPIKYFSCYWTWKRVPKRYQRCCCCCCWSCCYQIFTVLRLFHFKTDRH